MKIYLKSKLALSYWKSGDGVNSYPLFFSLHDSSCFFVNVTECRNKRRLRAHCHLPPVFPQVDTRIHVHLLSAFLQIHTALTSCYECIICLGEMPFQFNLILLTGMPQVMLAKSFFIGCIWNQREYVNSSVCLIYLVMGLGHFNFNL